MEASPYLEIDGVKHKCTLCEKSFTTLASYYDHCSNQHEWCGRCHRVFRSAPAKISHFRVSIAHNFCSVCPPLQSDYKTYAELQDHLVELHHFCPDCDVYCKSKEDLQKHDIGEHNLCVKCGEYFTKTEQLQIVITHTNIDSLYLIALALLMFDYRQHEQKHHTPQRQQPKTGVRDLQCYGCDRTFRKFSSMLIHLESGNCASFCDMDDIDDMALDCHHNRDYVEDSKWPTWAYICPTCESEFGMLSALYQHAEAVPLCSSPLNGKGCLARLQRFLGRNLDRYLSDSR